MRWKRQATIAVDASTAFISEGSEVSGTCSFNGTGVLRGTAKGDIRATAKLIVERASHVEARLYAPIVIIDGEVFGRIVATERIELREHARVFGDLETTVLIIEEGAIFEGQTKPAGGRRAEGAEPAHLEEARSNVATLAAAGS
jgi:cytoskeletal protein CcmA (bactofilin family)